MNTGKRGRRKKGQRKDGLIAVYGSYGRDASGRRIRKSFYGHSLEEARRKQEEFERQTAMGMPTIDEKLTVAQWCDIWMETYKPNIGEAAHASYLTEVKRIKDAIGQMQLCDVRSVHLQRLMNTMEGMSKSSITKFLMIARQIFGRAKDNRLIADDPSVGIGKAVGAEDAHHRALERWEIDLILEHWQEHRSGLWFMIMMLAGLRRGELIALQWEDVDLDRREISIHRAAEVVHNVPAMKDHTKTEAGMRTVPICGALYDALSTVPKEQRTGLICTWHDGQPLTAYAFDRGRKDFCLKMEAILNTHLAKGDGPWTFSFRSHDLRYTYATMLYDADIDIKSAQHYLGHANAQITMNLYTQLSKERSEEAHQKTIAYIDRWLQNGKESSENPN